MENILLTGATGVLGARLLQEILQNSRATVYCLIRASDVEEALKRLQSLLNCYDEHQELNGQLWRIVPVLGDVSKPKLGLSEDAYHTLTSCIQGVLHCAANVNLIAPYSKLSPVNVGGVHNVIDLCLEANAPLMYASSFSMIGDKLYTPGFVLREKDHDVGQGFADMDYERTKFVGEKSVREATERGLQWTIIRPGNIWGDSVTGRYPLTQTKVRGLYYEMVKSLVETGVTFPSDENFDITPVDYVAQAAWYALSSMPVTCYKTYNLTQQKQVSFDDVVQLLRSYGYTVREADTQRYFEALQQGRLMRGGRPYQSAFTDLLALVYDGSDDREYAQYETTQIKALLEPTAIRCPVVNEALMARYLDYAVRVGFLPAPSAQGPLAEIVASNVGQGFMERLYDAEFR